jgi:RimJ/RimL family protein N-acetyltransferase
MYAGELVELRAREPEYAELMVSWHRDPETMRWWDRVYPPLPAEAFAARVVAAGPPSFAEPSFLVHDRASGTAIGWGALIKPSPEHRHAELGVLIGDAAYRGRGYGTDTVRTLCRFAFDAMNLVRVSLTVFPGNVAGRRAYARVGFVEEGVQRRAMYRRGERHDLVHMAVFRDTLT